jgi:hypothetical protein
MSTSLINKTKERFNMVDLRQYSTEDLIKSLEAETAKSLNETRTCLGDLEKIKARLSFILAIIHTLKDRKV